MDLEAQIVDAAANPENYAAGANPNLFTLAAKKLEWSKKQLTERLGYSSSHSYYAWRQRGNFPSHVTEILLRVLQENYVPDEEPPPMSPFRRDEFSTAGGHSDCNASTNGAMQVLTIVTNDQEAMGALRSLAQHFRDSGRDMTIMHGSME